MSDARQMQMINHADEAITLSPLEAGVIRTAADVCDRFAASADVTDGSRLMIAQELYKILRRAGWEWDDTTRMTVRNRASDGRIV